MSAELSEDHRQVDGPAVSGTPPIDARAWWEAVEPTRGSVPSLPEHGRPVKVAFVGQRTYFEVCSQTQPSAVIEPNFVEYRSGKDPSPMVGELAALDPDVVVVFRPEVIPPGVLRALRALVVGFVTEPLPREQGERHPDLDRRLQDLAAMDPAQFDRIITFDPHVVGSVQRYAPVWRSMPLPVDDRLHLSGSGPERSLQPLFVGRSTPHRESFLLPAKHLYDLLHVEHGVHGTALRDLASRHLIAVNLHNEPYPSFENRVPLHLAMGNLVISEPLSPTYGLEPDLDFLEVRDPDDFVSMLGLVADDPRRFDLVLVRGRQKAKTFLASKVYAQVLLDLFLDVAVFGGRPRRTS